MAAPAVTLTFTLVDNTNTGIPGKVVLTLKNFGNAPPLVANTSVIANQQYTVQANSSGVGTVTFWGNYQLTATNSFYEIAVYGVDQNGVTSNAANAVSNYQFSSAGTFDLSTLTPINQYPGAPVPLPPTAVITNPSGVQTVSSFPLAVAGVNTTTTNGAASGFARLAKSDTISFRNNANSADLSFGIDSSDRPKFNGAVLPTVSANNAFTGNNTHSGTETFTNRLSTGNLNDILVVDGVQYANIAAAVTAAGSNPRIILIPSTYSGTECPASTTATLTFWDFRGGSETCTQNSVSWNQTSASGLHTMARFIQTRTSPASSDLAVYGQSIVTGALPANNAMDGVSGEVDTTGTLTSVGANATLAGVEGTAVLGSLGQTIPAVHGGVFNVSSAVGNTTGVTNVYVLRAQQYSKSGSETPVNLYSILAEGQNGASGDNYAIYSQGGILISNNQNVDAIDASNGRQHFITFTGGNLILFRPLLDANGVSFRNQASTSDWFHADSTHAYFYDSKLSVANNGQLQSALATGTAPLTVASTTPVANLTAVPTTYNAAGSQITGSHIVEDSGALVSGTPSTATITLAGSAAFTSNATYHCTVTNQTTQANPLKITYTDGSHFVVTGPNTVTDGFSFVCIGN